MGLRDHKVEALKEEPPFFSIIIATFNAEQYLQRALDSVRKLDFKAFELLVIDGDSTDATTRIIKENEDLIDFTISEPDDGIYSAWNKGIRKSRAPWIVFIGSDDILDSQALNELFKVCSSAKELDYVSGRVTWIDAAGKKLQQIGHKWEWSQYVKFMNVAHVASAHARHYLDKHGLFAEKFRISADYELLLRKREDLQVGFADANLAYMTVGGASESMDSLHEIRKIKQAHKLGFFLVYYPFIRSVIYFFWMRIRSSFTNKS